MIVKGIIAFIGLLVGGWMIFDGSHVLIYGKYFGPEKPGPWSAIVSSLGLNPFKLGVPFVVLGLLWLLFLVGILGHKSWAWYGALVTSIASLWFLPVGTLFSVLYIVFLLVFRSRL